MRPTIVTGAAGFIGSHLAARLLDEGVDVVGVDNLNTYYDVDLKRRRLQGLQGRPGFHFVEADVADAGRMLDLWTEHRPDHVVHLAAQAGVRYSIGHPEAYVHSNLSGFLGVLEACRHAPVKHLLYASSSSVYGANQKVPFSEDDPVEQPVSFYAATKRANELMAAAYTSLYGIKATGLRFFTVYGPWGRPDMAYYHFAEDILEGRTLRLFNRGLMERDFTFITDAVEAIYRILQAPPPSAHRLLNIGNRKPVKLEEFVATLSEVLGKKAKTELVGPQPGDVPRTWADTSRLKAVTGFEPSTSLRTGLQAFADWLHGYRRGDA